MNITYTLVHILRLYRNGYIFLHNSFAIHLVVLSFVMVEHENMSPKKFGYSTNNGRSPPNCFNVKSVQKLTLIPMLTNTTAVHKRPHNIECVMDCAVNRYQFYIDTK